MKKAILAVLFLLVASAALAEEKLSDEKQAEMERQKLYEQWEQFEKELQEGVYGVLSYGNKNKTPEGCQEALQKMEDIIAREETFAKQHNQYYKDLLQDIIRCLNRLDGNEKMFHKCLEVLNNMIYTKTESGFPCSWNTRRLALEVLVHFSIINNPESKKKIFDNRAKMVEAYLLTWQEFKERFSPEVDAEMKKLLKDWDDYYHSKEYPQFLPIGGGWRIPKYPRIRPVEYVIDEEKQPIYKKYLDGYKKAVEYFSREEDRKRIRDEYPDRIFNFITDLYSEPPFATDELKEIMKKNNLEEEIQEDILQEITAAEKKHKTKEKKKAHQKKAKQKAAKAETVSPEE